VVFRTDSARLVNEVVPESFRFAADNFKEVINVHGSGITYHFSAWRDDSNVVNVIEIIVQADRGPLAETTAGQFTILLKGQEGQSIQADCNAREVQEFCLSYVEALIQIKKGGGGGPG
jgi:hypothetical protein